MLQEDLSIHYSLEEIVQMHRDNQAQASDVLWALIKNNVYIPVDYIDKKSGTKIDVDTDVILEEGKHVVNGRLLTMNGHEDEGLYMPVFSTTENVYKEFSDEKYVVGIRFIDLYESAKKDQHINGIVLDLHNNESFLILRSDYDIIDTFASLVFNQLNSTNKHLS